MIRVLAYTCFAAGIISVATHFDTAHVHAVNAGWCAFWFTWAMWLGLMNVGMRANERRTGNPFKVW